MDIWDVLRTARRRWWITLPVLVILLGVTYQMGSSVGAEYKASASTYLLGPNRRAERDPATGEEVIVPSNPFLEGNSTQQLNRALAIAMGSDGLKTEMVALGLSPKYELTVNNLAPITAVEVTADTEDQASGTMDEVLSRMDNELQDRQDAVDADPLDRASLQQLSRSSVEPDTSARRRVLGVFFVISIASTLAAGVAADGIIRVRQRRRAARGAAAPVAVAVGEPVVSDGAVPANGNGAAPVVAVATSNGAAEHDVLEDDEASFDEADAFLASAAAIGPIARVQPWRQPSSTVAFDDDEDDLSWPGRKSSAG